MAAIHILIIEDSEEDTLLLLDRLRRGGLDASHERVETGAAMLAALQGDPPDLILADYKLPTFTAEAALDLLHGTGLDIPFILISGQIGEERAAGLMKAGAHDFVLKDRLTRLVPAVLRELADATDRREHLTERVLAEQERQRLEQQLRQAERLESLGMLAGGIAHDFNNLLAVISGYADLLAADIPDGSAGRPDLDGIRHAARRGAALTRQLLIFSRREPSRPETLDLNAVVADTERMLRRTIGEDVELTTLLAENLSPVTIDRSNLEQIILNLVVNARAAMPGGGRLSLRTSTLEHPRRVRLTVTDSGWGMAPEVAERAFEPFFTTKGLGEGTGLGLATVYGAVKDAGGDITLRTDPGHGTTFHIDLPAADARVTPTAVRAGEPAPGQGEVILVVEDEDAVREIIRRILTRAGYRVLEAATPAAALQLGSQPDTRIDVLLTDAIMPEMSGGQLIERFTRTRPTLPTLLMSGYTAQSLPGGQTVPADTPLIRKPFEPATLLRHVRAVLDR